MFDNLTDRYLRAFMEREAYINNLCWSLDDKEEDPCIASINLAALLLVIDESLHRRRVPVVN
jgi:hypothetical protein|tara:strand:+ start:280 stop:465 length:186 start_codon:yes stop_codon:yes gene_type:complete